MENLRRQGRRLAWLMAGAAIALAVALLVVTVSQLGALTTPIWLVVLLSLALAAALGLVPGVRELEVTGTRSMLGTTGELLVPQRPRAAHHLQTALWVLLHLMGGLLVAVLLATILPSAVLVVIENARGTPLWSGVPVPGSAAGRAGMIVLALLTGAASLGLWWPLTEGLARLAPRLLGPTSADRLELVRQRADREAQRTRIARELHDGIGHALTIVGVQAAAARRVQHRDPEAVSRALAAIEDTARGATGELDAMLALLREEERGADGGGTAGTDPREDGADGGRAAGSDFRDAPATPQGRRVDEHRNDEREREGGGSATAGTDLRALLETHRIAGMDLREEIALPEDLAPLQQRHLLRCVAELLTNAHRHGGDGPVHVSLSSDPERIGLEVRNSRGPAGRSPRPTGGRGLAGIAERAALLGGTLQAGPDGGDWLVRLDLPLLKEGPPR